MVRGIVETPADQLASWSGNMPLFGRKPSARRARWTSLFGDPHRPVGRIGKRPKKPAPSLLQAASRVECAVCRFIASGCRSVLGFSSSAPEPSFRTGSCASKGYPSPSTILRTPGGCAASCPHAHQPARGHRHVRNWARGPIGESGLSHKRFFVPRRADRRHVNNGTGPLPPCRLSADCVWTNSGFMGHSRMAVPPVY